MRAVLVLSVLGYGGAGTVYAEEKRTPEWYQIEATVNKDVQAKGLTSLLRTKYDGVDVAAVMREFNLRVRAGDFKEASRQIKKMASLTTPPDSRALTEMADFLINRREMDLARLFLETFPVASPGWGYVFLDQWYESAPGKKLEATIDSWLAKRIETGRNSLYWKSERVGFLDKVSSARPYLIDLTAEIKKNPRELQNILDYIDIAERSSKEKADMLWLPAAVNVASPYSNFLIGEKLVARYPSISATFLERSLSAKYTPDDQKRLLAFMRTHSALFHSPNEDLEPGLRSSTKQRLAEAYQHSRRPEQAQKLLVELSKEHPGGVPVFAMSQMAGAIQSQLPYRPLEKMIKAAEPENKDSPEYWLGRASYYTGRKEHAQVIDAFEKALAHAPMSTETNARGVRRNVISSYAYYLRNVNQLDKAGDLLWKEFDATTDIEYQANLVDTAYGISSELLKSNNKSLWSYLSRRAVWDRSEELAILRMFESNKIDAESFWRRCEQFAVNGDPSRAAVLGWVMTRAQNSARSIPLLSRACSMIKDPEKLQPAQFTLFEAYLDTNRWKEAEKIWPQASKLLTPEEVPTWFSKIVLAAARSGANQDALRLWKRKDEIDRSFIAPLSELSKLGIKSSLTEYYRKMAKEEPSSSVPKQALRLLGVS